MKRASRFLLLFAALVPFVLSTPSPKAYAGTVGQPVDPDPGGSPQPTCYCAIHCGNDSAWGGYLTPDQCYDKYNGVCGTSGGNVACGDLIPYQNVPHGSIFI